VNTPHSGYPKGKVEELKLQIQKILGAINTPSTPLDETHGTVGSAPSLVPISRHDAVATFAPGSGTLLAPLAILYGMLITP
jgi:hypothetical protein